MTAETQTKGSSSTPMTPDWEPPMPPTDLIFDDGIPTESNRHRIAMNLLIDSLYHHWRDRSDFFAGGNMFIYYSSEQARNRDFRGPDFFVVRNVDSTMNRKAWVVWEENGRYPDAIVELMSPSTAQVDLESKQRIYEETFRTPDYFVFDPFEPNYWRGWHLETSNGYQPLTPNEQGWLWCQSLELWLGTWEGILLKETAVWLRFYDRQGNRVPVPEEAARQDLEQERQRAENERQRAERLAARLRELGENPDDF